MSKEKSTAEVDQPSTPKQDALATPKQDALATYETDSLSQRFDPQSLLSKAIENRSDIETFERLVALAERWQTMLAKRAWYEAIAIVQANTPTLLKTRKVDAGSLKFRYAPLSEILEIVGPIMGNAGLSVSFRTVVEGVPANHVAQVCRISHRSGHYEDSGAVVMPIPPGMPDGKGANAMMRVGIATAYAQRYAFRAVAGIVPVDPEDEDTGRDNAGVSMPRRASEQEPPAAERSALSGKQISRLWAIAHDSGKKLGKSGNEVTSKVNALLGLNGATSVTELTVKSYDAVCTALEAWGNDAA